MQKSYISTLYNLLKEDKKVISCLSDSGTDYDGYCHYGKRKDGGQEND